MKWHASGVAFRGESEPVSSLEVGLVCRFLWDSDLPSGWQRLALAGLLAEVYLNDEEERVLKMRLREGESIHEAVRRFRKLVERSGIRREVRRREYYEKPSATKRRARLRAERRGRRLRTMLGH